MAFTVAHMAAVLPLKRVKWLCFDALLIGTMLPDLPYYIDGSKTVRQLSHEWIGLFTYCLPWGLLVFTIWFWLLKPAVIELMKPWFAGLKPHDTVYRDYSSNDNNLISYTSYPRYIVEIKACIKFGLYFWLKVILGLLLGAVTHLLWDGITHSDGFVAIQMEWLQHPITLYTFSTMTGARILQYLSSIVGLFILISSLIYKRSASTKLFLLEQSHKKEKKWLSVVILGLILSHSFFWLYLQVSRSQSLFMSDNYTFFAETSVSLIQSLVVGLIIYAIIFQLVHYFITIHSKY